MNYSENNKNYGRKIIKGKRKIRIRWKFVAAYTILLLIGFLIGFAIVSGITHMIFCKNVTKVEASVIKPKDAVVKIIEEPKPISLGEYKLTAYCACYECCGKHPGDVAYGITASGVKAVEGVTIAADPRVLPFGTKVIIDGHEYTVQDTGGLIKGKKIDIYFENHQTALEFGVQNKEIYTMKEGEIND